MERQMEDQCQKLHITEINLATEKQTVLNFKAKLQKTKEAARVAREAAKAAMNTSYEHEVLDTKTYLAEDVAIICRDYVTKSWGVAINRAGVPADSKLRRVENIFYPEDIWEILSTDPPTEQPLTAQAPPPDGEVSKWVGVDEESQLLIHSKPSEDTLTIKDMVSQAKDMELKSQANPKDPLSAKTNV